MSRGIIGKKIGMTSVFHEDKFVPATVIQAGPCFVVDVLTKERNGYEAVKLGYEEARASLVNKPETGVCKKAGVPTLRYLKEFRGMEGTVGQKIDVGIFDGLAALDDHGSVKGQGLSGTGEAVAFCWMVQKPRIQGTSARRRHWMPPDSWPCFQESQDGRAHGLSDDDRYRGQSDQPGR